ncbi:hypothetical protein BCON_0213g00010 [Botryotinia convoluta]|uniref:Alpha-type protein kinase domain-containing protein n=1 Tax=Botryotinia convoluta TaxID=54673 RepID=A0A4Z1HKD0_9HELO|nr:hypothetical protein BCON_0213g00010 [Botryotinia convoluta]
MANMSRAEVFLYRAPDDLEHSDLDDDISIANMTINVAANFPNESTEATVYIDRVCGSGNFKNAFDGFYTNGERSGQRCVLKQFKTGSVYQDDPYKQQLEIDKKAQSIIDAFNAANTPSEWHSDEVNARNTIPIYPVRLIPSTLWTNNETGAVSVIEPYIEGYRKFNSPTGWVAVDDQFGGPIQALSHFSYHISDGKMLLCDLQGGADANGYTLADPAIASDDPQRLYGASDMGPQCINDFFKLHVCEFYCNPQWLKPEAVIGEVPPIQRGLLPPYDT